MKKLLVSFLVLVGLSACQTGGFVEYPAGQTFQEKIVVGGPDTTLPLPEGNWELVTHKHHPDGFMGGWNEAMLIQVEDGKLQGIVRGWGPDRPAKWGFNPSKSCEDKEQIFVEKRLNVQGGVHDCRFITHWVMTYDDDTNESWMNVFNTLRERGVEVPVNMITAGYIKANRTKLMSVYYAFNPEVKGFSAPDNAGWTEGDWNKKNLINDEKKVEFIEGLKSWSQDWDTRVNEAFDGYLAL